MCRANQKEMTMKGQTEMNDIKVYVTDQFGEIFPVCGFVEWYPETKELCNELVETLKHLGIVKKHGLTIHVEC